VGDSKSMLESELRNRDIKWITNAKTTRSSPASCSPPS
jgi:sulfide:quinone oxidoreductase